MNRYDQDHIEFDDTAPHGPGDELHELLAVWHRVNAERAAAGRDRLIRTLRTSSAQAAVAQPAPSPLAIFRRLVMNRYTPAAASLMLLVVAAALLVPAPRSNVFASEILVPEGGRLDAVDEHGDVIGACPLSRTDVDVAISGRFARVTLRQAYRNPYDRKIEAVYTFPMSHRAAVDRMTMTIGERVIVGEVKERGEARRVYEQARAQGYVASLLEQERPNIFTQSVANIEPNAEVEIEIAYVEMVEQRDGRFHFDFPMTVAPRYVPGRPIVSPDLLPAELAPRHGVVLLGPADVMIGAAGTTERGVLGTGRLRAALERAQAIQAPDPTWFGEEPPVLWYRFGVTYADGSMELGTLHDDGTGQLNGRWFYLDPDRVDERGTGFALDTDQVPDASRVTPMPVKPPTRAGHDIGLTVTIDSGGPAVLEVDSELHEIVRREERGVESSRVTLELMNQKEIPNRDFVLSWRQRDASIEEAVFAHYGSYGAYSGGFFSLVVAPPARVDDADIQPRELIFVMDCSGSMEGHPIEKAKAIMLRAVDAMRDGDRFNVITFNESTDMLWASPRPSTPENREAARTYLDSRIGGGGTEMRPAIQTALKPSASSVIAPLTIEELANTPADDRVVRVRVSASGLGDYKVDLDPVPGLEGRPFIELDRAPFIDGPAMFLATHEVDISSIMEAPDGVWVVTGSWTLRDGTRMLVPSTFERFDATSEPFRIMFFLSDGEVGNDDEVIAAVRANAAHTRVFSVGIGNSPNRSLLDAMAKAGRGASDFVSLEADADAAVERFVRRIERPVLTNIEVAFSEGLEVSEWLAEGEHVPDLYDEAPLILHGRYSQPGSGSVTIRGRSGHGPYERTIALDFPEDAPEHDVIATLWARERIDARKLAGDMAGIIDLGTAFGIMSEHTSFVAVEKSRVTIDGEPILVAVPIEMPAGQSWPGTFGGSPQEVHELVRRAFPERRVRFESEVEEVDVTRYALIDNLRGATRMLEEGNHELAKREAQIARYRLGWAQARFDETMFGEEGDRAAVLFDRMEDAGIELGEVIEFAATDTLEAGTERLAEQRVRALSEQLAQVEDLERVDMVRSVDGNRSITLDKMVTLEGAPEARGEMQQVLQALVEDPRMVQRKSDWFAPAQDGTRQVLSRAYARATVPDQMNLAETQVFFDQVERGLDFDTAGVALRDLDGKAVAGGQVAVTGDVAKLYKETTPELQGAYGYRGFDVTPAPEASEGRVLDLSLAVPMQLEDQTDAYAGFVGLITTEKTMPPAVQVEAVELRAVLSDMPATLNTRPTAGLPGLVDGTEWLGAEIEQLIEEGEVDDEDHVHAGFRFERDGLSALPDDPDHRLRLEWIQVVLDAEATTDEERAVQDLVREIVVGRLQSLREHWMSTAPDGAEMVAAPPRLSLVFHPSDDPFFLERGALLAVALVEAEHVDEARTLAHALLGESKKLDVLHELVALLDDQGLGDDERRAAAVELASRVRDEVARLTDEAIDRARKAAREERVLDPRLIPFARGNGFPDEMVDAYDGPWPPDAGFLDGGALVTILVVDTSPETREALEAVGVKIADVSEWARLVIGGVPLGRFDELAQVDAVRRVEPLSR